MTQAAGDPDRLAVFRARNAFAREVRGRLKGRGLDVRERDSALVISFPGHPEKGRYYIALASGEVTQRVTFWDYLGYLEGHGDGRDPDDCVSLEAIIGALTNSDSVFRAGPLADSPVTSRSGPADLRGPQGSDQPRCGESTPGWPGPGI
jgi:hypothetical protein